MTAMTTKLNVFSLIFFLLGFVSVSCGRDPGITTELVKKIFLSKQFNSTESEWILNSARDSFLYLKEVEKKPDVDGKLNFAKNYANFLLELFNKLQTEDVDIYELFSRENSFLKGYRPGNSGPDFNITELKMKIEEVQFAAEQNLVAYYNETDVCHQAAEVLALNRTSFDAFLKEKLRADFAEIGYFFLEVFATLIGLSWGVISAALYLTGAETGDFLLISLIQIFFYLFLLIKKFPIAKYSKWINARVHRIVSKF